MVDSVVCEFRCPIHGFIGLNEWETRIVNTPVFQRLRRIRQLAWTDLVYPGAMHTRFEHSLGVMHVASRLYDSIVAASSPVLKTAYGYTDIGLNRDRQKVRLAALLHDIGHSPFSHGSEELFPDKPVPEPAPDGKSTLRRTAKKKFKHEDYSVALIRRLLKDAIDNDEWNRRNYGITAEEVAAIIEGSAGAGPALFWRDLLSGQLDADRMDYLLRDSHHTGVNYGKYDLHRLVSTVRAFMDESRNQKTPRIGVSSGGWYAAEGLILARYLMYKQVYFHKTRIAYDIHLKRALQSILPTGQYPAPTADNLREYVKWDDWRVLGLLANGAGGEHGNRLLTRNHYRLVYHNRENPPDIDALAADEAELSAVKAALGSLIADTMKYQNNWYKHDSGDIPVQDEQDLGNIRPLSEYSSLLREFTANDQELIYVKPEDVPEAKRIITQVTRTDHSPQLKMEFVVAKKKEVANVS
jgi:HD superfamily phosphohydrolase